MERQETEAKVTSHGDLQAREGIWLYSLGNGKPLVDFKLASDLIASPQFRMSTLATV